MLAFQYKISNLHEPINTASLYLEEVINDRLSIIRVENGLQKNTFGEDVRMGLNSFPKYLYPKYFYDEAGSVLFEQICDVPEYYVTRTEASILKRWSDGIAAINPGKKVIIELGSGSSVKTRYILNSFIKSSDSVTYHPIDVSDIMIESSKDLLDDFEGLKIKGIISEYEEGLVAVDDFIDEPKLIIFLGSSIGNFNSEEAKALVSNVSKIMNSDDSFLIGFDMVKDINILHAAYNDEEGITAKFNLNLLSRINYELGGNFDLSKFEHTAFFNEEKSRVEMHLIAKEDHEVYIENIDSLIDFKKGETIHTENSGKFTHEMIRSLASQAGLRVDKSWKDENNYFELCMMKKKTKS